MGQWHKSGCVLCAQNCGLELLVEDGKIVKSRPDKDNPRSEGYACRKGLNVRYHQYPKDRLTEPLKKVNGKFEPVAWDQAISEIAEKMQAIHKEHGPRALAYMGGSAQGGHLEATFGLTWLRNLGSRYYYSSAGQEFSDSWWLFGRMLGKQYNVAAPDEHAAEVLIAWGWNGMMSHQMPQARKTLRAISKALDKMLIAVDPRKSETAAIANMHVAVRPGSDALLLKAMIAIIVEKGWEKAEYIQANVEGWNAIKSWFEGFDYKSAIAACELDLGQILEFCRILATKKWCVHPDLGLYMGRKGVYSLYLLNVLAAICGRFCVRGGNVIPGFVVPMGFHADERDPKTWRTMATDMPPVAAGSFPPAVMPEEILSDNPRKLRAVYVSAVNPLRSYPDSQAYEEAFSKVDLLVVNDIAMTETARLADYVLPCRTFYESYDGTFFPNNFPEVFFQIRKPIVEPPPLCRESSQITTMLADKMGLTPEIPQELKEAAKGDRLTFGAKLMEFAGANPDAMKVMPLVLAKTLGEEWDSAALAAIWGLFMTAPKAFRENAARAGFEPGLDMGDRIFQALMDNPQGLWVGIVDPDENLSQIKTPSGKVEVVIPELEEGVKALDAKSESVDMVMPKSFPLILHAGRHMDYNINTLMRNPEWNKGKRACTVAVHPSQAEALGLKDGQQVEVFTEAGSAQGELQTSDQIREGTVLIPHGFGLQYGDEVYGLNVNHLTKNTHRSTLGTPIHRFVPCRVEAV